ncbi:MAG: indolepyruvate ferredoxin oxidoreductase subunit alpha [Myxococcota bacterium]|jgi:indolepyruvate ferredoxin oxidoreductase alpha subunit|nr:indolepyruvate ferredoxin oxidoreductase subunit alpha [Myxococcota bacterium]
MHLLLQDETGKRVFLLGNEMIVRGALEAGVEVATAYPGTPSSEIADTFYELSKHCDLYFEYSTNEKIALEVAAGAAIAGMRSICSMKHVGLNVAADPLNTLSYTGVRAGMVIITADDPSMHSSQNEQDNRYYARLSLLPMVEPSDAVEAGRLARLGIGLSESLELPLLLRTTTRIAHTRMATTYEALTPRRYRGHFEKNIMRWVPVPAVARTRRPWLIAKQEEAYEAMQSLGLDRVEGDGKLGIIAAGAAYPYVKEVLEELGAAKRVKLLKLTSIHPLPRRQIEEVLRSCKKILVVEELEAFVETQVRALAQELGLSLPITGKGENAIPRHYELSPDRVRGPIARFVDAPHPARTLSAPPPLPSRPPMLCAGCTHRTTYYAIKSIAEPDTYFPSDIGCYTLGLLPPLSTTDSFLCMGSSVTMASGVSIRNPQPHVAFIGDSTFFHSGITGLINAVHNKHDLFLVILDNSTTAMTGHQPHPGGGTLDAGRSAMDIERLVRGIGVEDVRTVDPENLKEAITVVQDAYRRKGVRVVISRHACPLFARRILLDRTEKVSYQVDQERCKTCGKSCSHEPCGVPIHADDEILRGRTKILSVAADPWSFPAAGAQRKPTSTPCTFACPANICAFGYLSLARAGRYKEALALVREQVPLPAVLGRVCHHPCEAVCVRKDYDGPVAINGVKRFLTEQETEAEHAAYLSEVRQRIEKAAASRPSPCRVAVVGAGPAGLAAAFDLRVRGAEVTIFEKECVPGGLLATGIPAYRLPREVLGREIDSLLCLGIHFEKGKALGKDFSISSLLENGFDAVCLAFGAALGMRLALPGEQAKGVEDALTFLRRANLLQDAKVGSRVVVVGGGDAALDAARTARRLGASQVTIAYRRSAKEMPASPQEVAAALAEGIEISYQVMPKSLKVEGCCVRALELLRTELGEPDAKGRKRPLPVQGSEYTLPVDMVIAAVGQAPDLSVLDGDVDLARTADGSLRTDEKTGRTSHERVFAAGDLCGRGSTVIAAIAEGKIAAYGIDELLLGKGATATLELHKVRELGDEIRYHPQAVLAATRTEMPQIESPARLSSFAEVELGFNASQVASEASRCLSCGQCARCNNCIDNFGCPAIYKREGKVYIDEVLCVGCGVCAQLCPNDAIAPVKIAAGLK